MGRFTERCIENLLGELQVYAERANEAMSLIVDNSFFKQLHSSFKNFTTSLRVKIKTFFLEHFVPNY